MRFEDEKSMLLENELAELERFIQHMDKRNSSVSASTVGWHIDHSLRVIIGIFRTFQNSINQILL